MFALLCLPVLSACEATMPSAKLSREIRLPVPATVAPAAPTPDASDAAEPSGETVAAYSVTARRLITLTFDLHPDIKSSYNRFKSEEARYDFFYVSRDSLTPRFSVTNEFEESRANETVGRDRAHVAELSLEKRFFDTTEADIGVGFQSAAEDGELGDRPFVAARLRYPLWASRERLERASEEIFRRNEVDDAQLDYIQRVRSQIERALFAFYSLAQQGRTVEHLRDWRADLEQLAERLRTITERDVTTDQERLQAEVTRVAAEVGVAEGWYNVQAAKLKLAVGIPFESELTLEDDYFNPFERATQDELLVVAEQTDPEILTLRNAMDNAQAQFELAKRGRWDIALLLSGRTNLEGRGEDEGVSDWSASLGFEISAVDDRVTDSLIRQAEANIERFRHAIAQRRNAIFVDTLEPLIRLDTLSASRDDLIENLPRYADDFAQGVDEYLAGQLNIDDLIERREDLFDRQQSINDQTFLLGANVTELCTATGKFFELLDHHIAEQATQSPLNGREGQGEG